MILQPDKKSLCMFGSLILNYFPWGEEANLFLLQAGFSSLLNSFLNLIISFLLFIGPLIWRYLVRPLYSAVPCPARFDWPDHAPTRNEGWEEVKRREEDEKSKCWATNERNCISFHWLGDYDSCYTVQKLIYCIHDGHQFHRLHSKSCFRTSCPRRIHLFSFLMPYWR